MYAGTYDASLVLLSSLIAILASYSALELVRRISTVHRRETRKWIAAGACALGTGIWSMHFVGMLALSLPIPLGYDPSLTFLSLALAIASSAFALWSVSQPALPWTRLACGALIMGAGISAMHYTGMAALRMDPAIRYAPLWLLGSIGTAVAASGAALWIAHRLRRRSSHTRLLRAGAAVIMGAAIVGMHYSGMAAAKFSLGSTCGAARDGVATGWLTFSLVLGTMAVIAIGLTVPILDRRLRTRAAALAESLSRAQELAYLATHDSLTDLPNRVLLEQRLEQVMGCPPDESHQIAVMFVDLDGFKAINDALGHHVGDLLLKKVGQRMLSTVSAEDMVARIGGDEFIVLVMVSGTTDASAVAGRILAALNVPFELRNHELRVSASIGIAIHHRADEHSHDLLVNADAAMYRAKEKGRNSYCFHDASMNANAREQLQTLQELRLAVERKEWVLHYQLKIDSQSKRVTGMEALLRWNHPTRGLLPPGEFIHLAEKAGLIVPIGEWVIHEACRQMAQWHVSGHRNWAIAVNLSPVQFRHQELAETVRAALAHSGLPPESLILEITESTAMDDVDASMGVLLQLRDMGVHIAIDDFGTGYSSLLYLKRLPANELKIDRAFVRDLPCNAEDAAIVSAIVALGKTLNLRVVAEGVETTEQQSYLTQLGCHSLQGFLFGFPVSADEVTAVAAQYSSVRESRLLTIRASMTAAEVAA